jgi:hypothetical protein
LTPEEREAAEANTQKIHSKAAQNIMRLGGQPLRGGEPLPMVMPQGSQTKLEALRPQPRSSTILYNHGENPERPSEPISVAGVKRGRGMPQEPEDEGESDDEEEEDDA